MTEDIVRLRPEFEAALRLFARASTAMTDKGSAPRCLSVAQQSNFSLAAIATGDFDISTPRQEAFEEILREHDLGSDGVAAIMSVEDVIADRMGQFASGSAPEMLDQAWRLLVLHSDLDRAYLDRRVREETADDYGIDDIQTHSA